PSEAGSGTRPAAHPGAGSGDLTSLPRLSDLLGQKMVTESGKLLGLIDDVLIDDQGARIVGYALGSGDPAARLGTLLGHEPTREPDYVRADANLRVGDRL